MARECNFRIGTCDGYFNGEFRVAEDREHGRDAGDDVGQYDGGAGVFPSLEASEHEDSGSDDGADPEPHQVPPRQRPLHLVHAPRLHLVELRRVEGPAQGPIPQPHRCLLEGVQVAPETPEGLLREEVVLRARAAPPLDQPTVAPGDAASSHTFLFLQI